MIHIIFTRKRLLVGVKSKISEILEIRGLPFTEVNNRSRVEVLAEVLPEITRAYEYYQERSRIHAPEKVPVNLVFPIDTPLEEIEEAVNLLQASHDGYEVVHLDNLIMPFMYGLTRYEERIAVPCVILEALDDHLGTIYFHRPAKIDAGSYIALEEDKLPKALLSEQINVTRLQTLGIQHVYLIGKYLNSEEVLDFLNEDLGLKDKIAKLSNANPLTEYKLMMKGLALRGEMQNIPLAEQIMERDFKLQNWKLKHYKPSGQKWILAPDTRKKKTSTVSATVGAAHPTAIPSRRVDKNEQVNSRITEKDAEIRRLKKTLETKTARLKELELEITSKLEESSTLGDQIRKDKGAGDELRKELDAFKKETKILKDSLKTKELEIEGSVVRIQAKTAENEDLRKKLKESEARLQELGVQIEKNKKTDEQKSGEQQKEATNKVAEIEAKLQAAQKDKQALEKALSKSDEELKKSGLSVENKNKELLEIKKQLEAQQKLVKELEVDSKKKDEKVSELAAAMLSKDEEMESLKESALAHSEELNLLKESIQELEKDRDHWKAVSEEKESEIEDFHMHLESRDSEIRKLNEILSYKREEVSHLKTSLKEKETLATESVSRLESIQLEFDKINETLEEKDDKISTLQEEVTKGEDLVKNKKGEISKLEKTLEDNNLKFKGLEEKIAEKDKKIGTITLEFENNRKKVDDLVKQLKKKDTIVSDLKAEIDNREANLLAAKGDLNFQKERLEKLKKALEEKESALSAFQNQKTVPQEKFNTLNTAFEEKKTEIQGLNRNLEAHREKISQLQKSLQDKENVVGKLNDQKKELEKEIENLRKSVSKKNSGVQELENYIMKVETRLKNDGKRFRVIEEQLRNKEEEILKLKEEIERLNKEKHAAAATSTVNTPVVESSNKLPDAASEARQLKRQLLIFEQENQELRQELDHAHEVLEQQSAIREKISVMEYELAEQKQRTMTRLSELEADLQASNAWLEAADQPESRRLEDGSSNRGIQKLLKSGYRLKGWF